MLAVSFVASIVALSALAGGSEAKKFEVTRYNDPKQGRCKPRDCSLRQAVIAANKRPARDRIVLPGRKRPYQLRLRVKDSEESPRTGALNVRNPITINHPGRGRATIDANRIDGVLDVEAPTRLSKLVIRRGRGFRGGGINAELESDDVLSLTRTRVTRNVADPQGGGIHLQGGTLRLTRSVVSANRARPGVASNALGGAIALTAGASARVAGSTLAQNEADFGGGIYGSGTNDAVVVRSTISGNSAASSGGGTYTDTDSLRLINSTVANNRANGTGGGIRSVGEVWLNAVTVARNTADNDEDGDGSGGGIARVGGTFALTNSVIGDNRLGDGALNQCSGQFLSEGTNVVNPGCAGLGVLGDTIVTNPSLIALGRLRDNGGPTRTIALTSVGSAAIDAANPDTAHGATSAASAAVRTATQGRTSGGEESKRSNPTGGELPRGKTNQKEVG